MEEGCGAVKVGSFLCGYSGVEIELKSVWGVVVFRVSNLIGGLWNLKGGRADLEIQRWRWKLEIWNINQT